MRVDEARHAEELSPVDPLPALVFFVRADDAVADDRDVGLGHRAGDDVEQPDIRDDEVGRLAAGPCCDRAGEKRLIHPLRYQGIARTGNRRPATARRAGCR